MTFIQEVTQECLDIWDGYNNHPFIQDIANNNMDEAIFHHYLVEDTIYLKEYARAFALGLYKSKTMEEMRLFYDLLAMVENSENAAHVKILKDMGTDVRDIENLEPTKENKAYTDFLLNTAKEEGIVEILFATLPCMLSYAYIGKYLIEKQPNIEKENTYGEWVAEYASTEYQDKCVEWSACAEALCAHYTTQQKQHLKDLFRESSIHEANFWDMSYKK